MVAGEFFFIKVDREQLIKVCANLWYVGKLSSLVNNAD